MYLFASEDDVLEPFRDALPDMEGLYEPGESGGLLTTVWRLRSFVRAWRPDVMHCSLPEASLATRIVGYLLRVPVVESLVNISHEAVKLQDNPHVAGWKLVMHRVIDRVTMSRVARFHALSEAVADSWVRMVGIPREKIVVIPRGVDAEDLHATAIAGPSRVDFCSDLGVPEDATILLNVGRQEPQKGQTHLIGAMPTILEGIPNAVLLIAGRPGNLTGRLEQQIADLGLEGRVLLLGRRTDVAALMAAADLFVFPSLYEGLGVSLLEAMAMALPIVVANRPPMNQLIKDGVSGMVCKPGDPLDLGRVVVEACGDMARSRRLGIRARQTVSHQGFSPAGVAARLEELYVSVGRYGQAGRRQGEA